MAGTLASVIDFSVGFGSGSLDATTYASVQGSLGTSTTENNVKQKQVRNGVASNLRILVISNNPGSGENHVTLRVNGADTALTKQITDSFSNQATLFEETTKRVPFSAGDELSLKITVGTSGSITIGSIVFQVEDTLP